MAAPYTIPTACLLTYHTVHDASFGTATLPGGQCASPFRCFVTKVAWGCVSTQMLACIRGSPAISLLTPQQKRFCCPRQRSMRRMESDELAMGAVFVRIAFSPPKEIGRSQVIERQRQAVHRSYKQRHQSQGIYPVTCCLSGAKERCVSCRAKK